MDVEFCGKCLRPLTSYLLFQGSVMYPSIRQSKMLERLRLQQFCNITELAEVFSVYDETVRRDVRQLDEMYIVHKVHRGVATLHETM